MDARMRKLIAIGASVSAHCQPCLAWHGNKAEEMEIAESEIREAIVIGHMVEKVSMTAMREFAQELPGENRSLIDEGSDLPFFILRVSPVISRELAVINPPGRSCAAYTPDPPSRDMQASM